MNCKMSICFFFLPLLGLAQEPTDRSNCEQLGKTKGEDMKKANPCATVVHTLKKISGGVTGPKLELKMSLFRI